MPTVHCIRRKWLEQRKFQACLHQAEKIRKTTPDNNTIRKIKRIKPQPQSQPTNQTKRATVTSSEMDSEEEDLAVLIYKTSKTAKERAAAAAMKGKKEKESSSSFASTHHNTTSTQNTSASVDNTASAGRKRKSPEPAAEYKLTSNNAPKKKQKKKCSAERCTSEARNGDGGVCIKHGAKRYWYGCSAEGCTNQAKNGGVCVRHGAVTKRCSVEGCPNHVIRGGVCVKHGAKAVRKLCSVEGCPNQVIRRGVCWSHGAKEDAQLCSSEGCKHLSVKGGVCRRHGEERKLCSSEGCSNQSVSGGVCIRHGAKEAHKLCSTGSTKGLPFYPPHWTSSLLPKPPNNPSTAANPLRNTAEGQEIISEPTENDVLCGRGGAIHKHPGNKRFRHFINELKYQYLIESRQTKPKVAMRVLQLVSQSNPPGRFLMEFPEGYLECSEERAKEKARQALQEGAAKLRKQGHSSEGGKADKWSCGQIN